MSGPPDGEQRRYVGFATRWIAFVADALLISFIALIVEAGVAVVISLLHLPKNVKTVMVIVGGAAYILWTVAYFVLFWSTTGQTPGSRILQIRVVTTSGSALSPGRAIVRCVGLVLAALPLFAGYLLILFDSQRRGLQDRLAGTVVVDAPQLSLAAERLARTTAAVAVLQDDRPRDRNGARSHPPVSGDDRRAAAFRAGSGHESGV
jgi:uncharacterized RDD family membrane protein YckC